MSYYVQLRAVEATLQQYRPAHEIGYSGPVVDLPAAMAAGYRTFKRMVEIRFGEDIEIKAFPDHTIRNRRPILKMRLWRDNQPLSIPQTSRLYFLEVDGSCRTTAVEGVEGHSDPFEWVESLGLGHSALHWAYVLAYIESGPEAWAEALRRAKEADSGNWKKFLEAVNERRGR